MADRLPRILLHAEGAAVFIASTTLYFHFDYPWWLYLALALAPDLSMLGFLAGARAGTASYDVVHTFVVPVALVASGALFEVDGLVQVGLIWLAHIGADRALGYGLKYPSGFKDTHLQRV
jgi:hypothetical protein